MSYNCGLELQTFSTQQLLSACRVLFGPDVDLSRDFLWYLQPDGAKSAYRRRAKERHPDTHPLADAAVIRTLQDEFNDITQAYQLLNSFLDQRGEAGVITPEDLRGERYPKQKYSRRRSYGEQGNFVYRSMPRVEIKTARYLYLKGITSFTSVLNAITWQRRQRPSIGVLARQWGWLDDAAVMRILRASTIPGRFGERAIKMGLLTPQQISTLLLCQQSSQQRIGRYFVMNGIVGEYQLEDLIREMYAHNKAVRLSTHHF